MPEEKILICKPISRPGYVVLGSMPSKCGQCGQPIWVSPSSMLLLHDNPDTKLRCLPCTLAHMETHPGTIAPLTPSQREEIEEYTRGGR